MSLHVVPPQMPRGNGCSADELAARITQYLAAVCPYRSAFRDIAVEDDRGVIRLRGQVASFYMKQLLQTYVAKVEGVQRIENLVDVISGQQA